MGYVLKEFDYSLYFDYTGYLYPTLTVVFRLFLHIYLIIN